MPSEGCLFTIEQIELLRRLRNTGLTKEQIVSALDTMTRVERELNSLSESIEVHEITRAPVVSSAAVTATTSVSTNHHQPEIPTQSLVSQFTHPQRSSSQSPASTSPSPISPLSGGETGVRVASSCSVTTNRGSNSSMMERLDTPTCFRDIADTDPELKFLASLSLQTTKGLLKDFLQSHNLMQKDLAGDIGITQSLASVFLNGPNALRPSTMLTILKWYVWKKRLYEQEAATQSPERRTTNPVPQTTENVSLPRLQAPSSSTTVAQNSTHKRMLQFLKLKKFRSRINWDPSAVNILEHHFNTKNRFPNAFERETIAANINGACHSKGRKVTAHHIQTWFNNRRNKRTGVSSLSQKTNRGYQHTQTHPQIPSTSTNQLPSPGHVTSPSLHLQQQQQQQQHQQQSLIQQASGFVDLQGPMMAHPCEVAMTTASVGLDIVDQAISALQNANTVHIDDHEDDVIRIKLET